MKWTLQIKIITGEQTLDSTTIEHTFSYRDKTKEVILAKVEELKKFISNLEDE